jgi:NAD+ kinase
MTTSSQKDLVGFAYNPMISRTSGFVESLVDELGLSHKSWVSAASDVDLDLERLQRTSVLITAGGDGTILRVARRVAQHEIPILAINMGRVGFMTELSVDKAAERIPGYLDGSARVEHRMMLKASLQEADGSSDGIELHALNDVVITRGSPPRLLDVETRIDGVLLTTYRADGVIVSTPTGSTSYSLSAGGPILYPEAKEIVIQPLAAHMSFQTGLVVSQDSVVELTLKRGRDAIMSVDGSTDAIEAGQTVVIERSPYVASFLRRDPAESFYATLTQRLGVSGRAVPPPRVP